MQSVFADLDRRSKRRQRDRRTYKNSWSPVCTNEEALREDWGSQCWNHEFLERRLNLKTYATATISYVLDGDHGAFEVKSAFLPLGPGGANDADVRSLLQGAEHFSQLGFPDGICGFSVLRCNNRGNKAAEGDMLMVGSHTVQGAGCIHSRNKNGEKAKHGDLRRYRANKERRPALENAVALYGQRFAKVEGVVVPKGAKCRLKLMETLDPAAEVALFDGAKHEDFNGRESVVLFLRGSGRSLV